MITVFPSQTAWNVVGAAGQPDFLNSWVNWDAPSYGSARFRRTGDVVEIEGLVKNGTLGTAVFTLPVGFRPVRRFVTAQVITDVLGRVDVQTDGNVIHVAGGAVTTYLSINLRFSLG